jgi:hypothetical protein
VELQETRRRLLNTSAESTSESETEAEPRNGAVTGRLAAAVLPKRVSRIDTRRSCARCSVSVRFLDRLLRRAPKRPETSARVEPAPTVGATRLLDAAALDGMALLGDLHESGGSFTLDNVARETATVEGKDGWLVEVRARSKVVVARGGQADSAEQAHARAIKAAQQGLDLLSIRGRGDLLIHGAEDEHLVWWSSHGTRILRVYAVAALRIDVPPVTGRVTDATGKEKPPPPEPKPVWHPSFRYFRLAQVSEEVFDAYRNLYLALESILSTATPPKPGEREIEWIPRALRQAQANGLNLAGFGRKDAHDPVAAIVEDLYSATRTATFHAKADKPTLLPLDAVDRSTVLDNLSRLAGLYLELVHRTLDVRRTGGGMFKGGFDMLIGGIANELEIHVTDDPVRMEKAHAVINPGGGHVRPLVTRRTPQLDQRFVATFMGETRVEDLADLTHVARVVATTREGDPYSAGQLEAHLTLGGFDQFHAVMGIRGLNVRTPRSFYDA